MYMCLCCVSSNSSSSDVVVVVVTAVQNKSCWSPALTSLSTPYALSSLAASTPALVFPFTLNHTYMFLFIFYRISFASICIWVSFLWSIFFVTLKKNESMCKSCPKTRAICLKFKYVAFCFCSSLFIFCFFVGLFAVSFSPFLIYFFVYHNCVVVAAVLLLLFLLLLVRWSLLLCVVVVVGSFISLQFYAIYTLRRRAFISI